MRSAALLLGLSVLFFAAPTRAVAQDNTPAAPTDRHNSPEWAIVAPHLPDPTTAPAAKLEMAGDVLRARKFPQDAIMFYKAAALRNGDPATLLMKEGVIYLEMQQTALARMAFQRAVKLRKKDAEAWNDLGAADFTLGNIRASVGEYKHAIKLKKSSAPFHSNLALAYFDLKDSNSARSELSKALHLDPNLMQHNDEAGYNLQILASTNYAEICFEMARVYAAQADADSTVLWLTRALERGVNVRNEIKGDALLQPYLRDPRVKLALDNADQLRNRNFAAKGKPPSLGNVEDKR